MSRHSWGGSHGSYELQREERDYEDLHVEEEHQLHSSPCPALAFVEADNFQLFIGTIIFSNIFTLWGETDLPGYFIWTVLDNTFLTIFCIELTLKIAYQGVLFFCGEDKWWHLLDVTIVGLGLSDILFKMLLGKTGNDGDHHKVNASSLVRSLRLLRLLRLLRVFHLFPSLMNFIKALWDMTGKFFWIFLILLLFMFCSSIILTKLLGQNDFAGVEGMDEDIEIIRTMFRTVPESLFSLFQVTTCDNWMLIASPAIRYNSYYRLFFIVYVVFASWILISILTAVASDSMIQSAAEKKEASLDIQNRQHKMFMAYLEDAFVIADTNQDGLVDKDEFTAWIDDETVREEVQRFGVKMSKEEFHKAWEMLDITGDNELNLLEFVSGFSYLHEALTTTHVVNIDYSLKRISLSMEHRIDRLREELAELSAQGEEMVKSLETQDLMQKAQNLSLWLWKEWVKHADPNCMTPDMADIPEPDAEGRSGRDAGPSTRSLVI